jgi:hypothetical protein
MPVHIPGIKFKTLLFGEDQAEIAQYEDELQEVVFELNYGRTQYDIFCKKVKIMESGSNNQLQSRQGWEHILHRKNKFLCLGCDILLCG